MDIKEKRYLIEQIAELKYQRRAILLGHYYARPEVQDVCDYVGDSLGLSRKAATSDAEVILFCGVHFMAETASILAQDRKVIIPSLASGCSLADSITGTDVERWKADNPDGVVIAYVNTTAEVKAHTDCCCTSANALQVVQQYASARKILFLPDRNLGRYIARRTGIDMELWDGACHVHDQFTVPLLKSLMAKYPEAEVLVHPESTAAWQDGVYDSPRVHIDSTSGLIRYATQSAASRLIVVTEQGTLHQMQRETPDKELILVGPEAYCEYMKHVTLQRVVESLQHEQYEVRVPADLAKRARLPIERMLAIG